MVCKTLVWTALVCNCGLDNSFIDNFGLDSFALINFALDNFGFGATKTSLDFITMVKKRRHAFHRCQMSEMNVVLHHDVMFDAVCDKM